MYMEEKLSIIISCFAGAMAAKNWSRIKEFFSFNTVELIFDTGEMERAKRVTNNKEESWAASLSKRKKVKHRRSARREQFIAAHQSKKETGKRIRRQKTTGTKFFPAVVKSIARAKTRLTQPAVQPIAKMISESAPIPNYKTVELPKGEQLSESEPEELSKPVLQE